MAHSSRGEVPLSSYSKKGLRLSSLGLGIFWKGLAPDEVKEEKVESAFCKKGLRRRVSSFPLQDLTNQKNDDKIDEDCDGLSVPEELVKGVCDSPGEFWSGLEKEFHLYAIRERWDDQSVGEVVPDSEDEEQEMNVYSQSGAVRRKNVQNLTNRGGTRESSSLEPQQNFEESEDDESDSSDEDCFIVDIRKENSAPSSARKSTAESQIEEPEKCLITHFFKGNFDSNVSGKKRKPEQTSLRKGGSVTRNRSYKKPKKVAKAPPDGANIWEIIPGTKFRVDGFRHMTQQCSHWFLTHFHADHYQGLTRHFRFGKIYCSAVTAKLLVFKIGIPEDCICVLPLNETVTVQGVKVTFFDANHCPGAVMILFQPKNKKAVLHTGDFRWCPKMEKELSSILPKLSIHTLILDTTFCDPKFVFPCQETVIQHVIDIIAAESFNPKSLFLIGTYVVGKERVFLSVARALQRKVYVGAAKQSVIDCLELPESDTQWLTSRESESSIHAVPLWSIANFKRLAVLSRSYKDKYDTIIAFSPSGFSHGCSGKRGPGRRRSKGTLVRYEIPYSEHCSFEELKEFVEFVDPEVIVPSVNNGNEEEAKLLVERLCSEGQHME